MKRKRGWPAGGSAVATHGRNTVATKPVNEPAASGPRHARWCREQAAGGAWWMPDRPPQPPRPECDMACAREWPYELRMHEGMHYPLLLRLLRTVARIELVHGLNGEFGQPAREGRGGKGEGG